MNVDKSILLDKMGDYIDNVHDDGPTIDVFNDEELDYIFKLAKIVMEKYDKGYNLVKLEYGQIKRDKQFDLLIRRVI